MAENSWPPLPLAEWESTYATLHMWSQIVGKVRLAETPLVNHWWNTPLYLTPRGLTTSAFPCGERTCEIRFDFIDHRLLVESDNGAVRYLPLGSYSVAEFHERFMGMLQDIGLRVKIWPVPVEVPDPVPFRENHLNRSYDREMVGRLWRILLRIDRVFNQFRARFIGKCSPVHFFWGSFDLAVSRFSGRSAPEREGADIITREAYSHEVISHGFWPGIRSTVPVQGERMNLLRNPAFYSYTVPEPPGMSEARIAPEQAFYCDQLHEWVLLYDDVRKTKQPERILMDFLQSTYEAGAELAGWDRAALERKGT